MLDTISDLVRNVTIIVLIAGFLEMLLPQGEIKKFVKAVLGLFILISILNPLLGLFDKNVVSEVLAWQDPIQENMELNSILDEGKEISEEMNKKALEMYRVNAAKQIETVVKLVKGVVWVEAKVKMAENLANQGLESIEKVVLRVGTADKEKQEESIKEIEPIEIDLSNPPTKTTSTSGPATGEIKENIRETLMNFYSLRAEQIEIIIVPEEEEARKNE